MISSLKCLDFKLKEKNNTFFLIKEGSKTFMKEIGASNIIKI